MLQFPVAIGAEIPRLANAPKPLSIEGSQKAFQIERGFEVQLVAAEPLIADPVSMTFGPKGRLFVVEIHGYNLEGHEDVIELNKKGILDKSIRRIPATPEAFKRAEAGTFGMVRMLEDIDGDGRMDRSTVWADKIEPCYGIVAARDGVIVVAAPDIWYFGDADGDGKPEVKEKLYSGFGVGEMWSRINHPCLSFDNWIYVASGMQSGGTITGPHLKKSIKLGWNGFRIKADGSAIEPLTGGTHGFGLTLNKMGDRFLVTNQRHAYAVAPLPDRYLVRNKFVTTPNPLENISSYGHPVKVYPTSEPHPWRLARSNQKEWVKFYGAAETNAGQITSACSPLVYQAGQFPAAFQNNHFSCEPSQNLIHRCVLKRKGLRYSVHRPVNDGQAEFLSSTDQWFRPVDLAEGPDGALYIVDMYREIIEDYSAIPRYLQQQYGLVEGRNRGRIWKVVAQSQAGTQADSVDLTTATKQQLLDQLQSNNRWRRVMAQQLFVHRKFNLNLTEASTLFSNSKNKISRLHLMYLLNQQNILTPQQIEQALQDAQPEVRIHAIQLAEPFMDQQNHQALRSAVYLLSEDADPRIRLQLAFTLGESGDLSSDEYLLKIAAKDGDDPWFQTAILSSSYGRAGRLLDDILQENKNLGKQIHLLQPLASVIGARRNEKELESFLSTIVKNSRNQSQQSYLHCLKGVVEGLKQSQSGIPTPKQARKNLIHLVKNSQGETRQLIFQIARALNVHRSTEMKQIFEQAAENVLNDELNLNARIELVTLLVNAPFSISVDSFADLLQPSQPVELQKATINALAETESPAVTKTLLASWDSYSPVVRSLVIEAIFRRTNRLGSLLDAIENKTIHQKDISAMQRVQLLQNRDAKIKNRAKTLLADSYDPANDEVLVRYQKALKLPGDIKKGELVYKKLCINCHKLNGQGHEVGPDMAAARGRANETLLIDILRPSQQITTGYQTYSVVTENGLVITGILAAETTNSITLKLKEKGKQQTILRTNILEMKGSPVSLMPDGLEKQFTPTEINDLIAFLRKSIGTKPVDMITLFDEEKEFPELLKQGKGGATFEKGEAVSGEHYLKITPFQRFSANITSWEYKITEKPKSGEFRYLRFAWKAPQATGVMLEIAASGKWAKKHESIRRYYSGENSSDFRAIQISPTPPREWQVVTRDLWKEFGEFTFTGIAPSAMGDAVYFDKIQLIRSLEK